MSNILKTQQLILGRKDLNQALGSGELKACPFCGSWAFSAAIQNERTSNYVYKVTCTGCHAQVHYCSRIKSEARDEAIKKWNRRA